MYRRNRNGISRRRAFPVHAVLRVGETAPADTAANFALQVQAEFSGVGRMVMAMGASLRAEGVPQDADLVVRCAADLHPSLAPAFPDGTRFHTPLRSSHPRLARLAYQQQRVATLLAPPAPELDDRAADRQSDDQDQVGDRRDHQDLTGGHSAPRASSASTLVESSRGLNGLIT